MQSLILKSLDYVNDHPNENGPNTKLKSLYNVSKVSWILNYGMVIFLPHHMNSILMEVWDACNVSVRNIISEKFVKNLPLSLLLTLPPTPRHVLPLSKSLMEPRIKTSMK